MSYKIVHNWIIKTEHSNLYICTNPKIKLLKLKEAPFSYWEIILDPRVTTINPATA